ncbi:hypothetical protein SGPA1_80008 [Streptomyces misionensis JCM 4497]
MIRRLGRVGGDHVRPQHVPARQAPRAAGTPPTQAVRRTPRASRRATGLLRLAVRQHPLAHVRQRPRRRLHMRRRRPHGQPAHLLRLRHRSHADRGQRPRHVLGDHRLHPVRPQQ